MVVYGESLSQSVAKFRVSTPTGATGGPFGRWRGMEGQKQMRTSPEQCQLGL